MLLKSAYAQLTLFIMTHCFAYATMKSLDIPLTDQLTLIEQSTPTLRSNQSHRNHHSNLVVHRTPMIGQCSHQRHIGTGELGIGLRYICSHRSRLGNHTPHHTACREIYTIYS